MELITETRYKGKKMGNKIFDKDKWIVSGWKDPEKALNWFLAGWNSPKNAISWYNAGWVDANEALKWFNANWKDPKEAYKWFTGCWQDPLEAYVWRYIRSLRDPDEASFIKYIEDVGEL